MDTEALKTRVCAEVDRLADQLLKDANERGVFAHRLEARLVHFVDQRAGTQTATPLGRLGLQQVALPAAIALETARRGLAQPLGRLVSFSSSACRAPQ